MTASHRRIAGTSLGAWAAAACVSSCSLEHYRNDADRDVAQVLADFEQRGLADRPNRVILPKPAPPPPAAPPAQPTKPGEENPPAAAEQQPGPAPMTIDLKSALSIAVHKSRDFQSEKESIYLSGLGYTSTIFGYEPHLSAALSAAYGKTEHSPGSASVSGSFGVSQLLPTNGTLAVSTGASRSWTQGPDLNDPFLLPPTNSTSLGIDLTQPLLRGAGYDQWSEGLTSAERGMVYAVRSFELFRENFSINIAESYFRLVSARKRLAIAESDYDNAKFQERRTKALRDTGKQKEEDVILATRRRVGVENSLLDQRAGYKRQEDDFKIQLGLDPATPATIVEEEPPVEPIDFDPDSLFDVAMNNRLDIQTQKEQLEDTVRRLKLQERDFLPDMSVTAHYGLSGGHDPAVANVAGGLSLNIPIQQLPVRNAYRQAEIQLDQQRRFWSRTLDDLRSNLQSQLRTIRTQELQIDLQKEQVKHEDRNVFQLKIKQASGTVSSREVVDAQTALVAAQNTLIDSNVTYFVSRLRFFRDLGLLFVDEDGQWSIGAPAGGPAPPTTTAQPEAPAKPGSPAEQDQPPAKPVEKDQR